MLPIHMQVYSILLWSKLCFNLNMVIFRSWLYRYSKEFCDISWSTMTQHNPNITSPTFLRNNSNQSPFFIHFFQNVILVKSVNSDNAIWKLFHIIMKVLFVLMSTLCATTGRCSVLLFKINENLNFGNILNNLILMVHAGRC